MRHPLVRKVAFTGSTPVGEQVAALAAVGSKRVTLELGGWDPMIICDDADLKAAASAAAMGRFYNCGQACLAIKRLYVFDSVADEIIEAVAAKAKRLRLGVGSRPGQPARPDAHASASATSWSARSPSPAARSSPAAGARRASTTAGSTSRRSSSSPARTRRWRWRRSSARRCRSGASRTWTRRSSWPTTRRSASGRRVWTQRPGPRRARRGRARLRLHVDQLAHEGLRRAALRRPEGLRLRQGTRLRSARLLHRSEERGGQARMTDPLEPRGDGPRRCGASRSATASTTTRRCSAGR